MATTIVYGNGKEAWEAGSYHDFRSGVSNPPISSDYGKVLIVDNGGFGAGFGFGSGINGELKNGLASFVEGVKTPQDLQKVARGGILYDLAYRLFAPAQGVRGVSEVAYIKAGKTTASTITMTFTNGSVTVNPLDEGLTGNGEVNADDMLVKGFGVKMSQAPNDYTRHVFGFFQGDWRGVDGAGLEIGTSKNFLKKASLIVESPAVNSIAELVSWMNTNYTFKSMFRLKTSSISSTGSISSADLLAWNTGSDWELATGGTETFSDDDLLDAIAKFNEVSFSTIFTDQHGANAMGSKNTKLQYYLENESRFRRTMWVGGGKDESEFESISVASAVYFDSHSVIVVDGGEGVNDKSVRDNLRKMPSLYMTALAIGRTLGLPPQVPSTSKSIRVDQLLHKMDAKSRRRALDKGVFHFFFDQDYGKIVINMDVNTMQENDRLIDTNTGASHLISTERIYTQLQTDMIIQSKKQILGNPNGVNRNTLTIADMITWTGVFLETKKATKNKDNIILSYGGISAVREDDAYVVTHTFTPNTEVNKIIFFSMILS